jgi:hypothetical protein
MVSFRPLFLSALLFAGSLSAPCAPRQERMVRMRRPVMRAETGGALSVNFTSLPDSPTIQGADGVGILDLGKVSWGGAAIVHGVKIQHQPRSFFVETSLGMQIGDSSVQGGTALLKAWLESPVAPYQVYLDGVPLSQHPVCVDAQAETGVVTRHQLKISVPVNTSEKQAALQTQIALQVVQN